MRITQSRGHVFLGQDQVFDLAVIGGALSGPAGGRPAPHGGMLEGLREVPAGVAARRPEGLRGPVQVPLQARAVQPGLDGDGLAELR